MSGMSGLGSAIIHIVNDISSPYALAQSQSSATFTNEGSSGKSYIQLPIPMIGLSYTFIVHNTNGLRFTADASSTIRSSTSVTATGGFAEATAIGASMTIKCINSTQWISISTLGSWTIT